MLDNRKAYLHSHLTQSYTIPPIPQIKHSEKIDVKAYSQIKETPINLWKNDPSGIYRVTPSLTEENPILLGKHHTVPINYLGTN